MKYFNKAYVDFFNQLENNNNREWFQAHKEIFRLAVEEPFIKFTSDLLREMAKVDSIYDVPAKQTIFRINKDMRFSQGGPYKLFRSALITVTGKRVKTIPGFYFEISAETVRLGGGLYESNKADYEHLYSSLKEEELSAKFIEYFGKINWNEKNRSVTIERTIPIHLIEEEGFLEFVLSNWEISRELTERIKKELKIN